MSRTIRNNQPWVGWSDGFEIRLARDNKLGTMQDPDDPWEEVWGPKQKRWAKKRQSRNRRVENKKVLKENIKEVNES